MLTRLFGEAKAKTVNETTLAGVTISIVGDIFHSRVARSNALASAAAGARRWCSADPRRCCPTLAAEIGPGVEIDRDFDSVLARSQVVMMLRIQAERLAGMQLDLEEYKTRYQLSAERLATHAPKALMLHPGPIIRGLELTADVADGPQSAMAEQVRHGVAIRMALVLRALEAARKSGKAAESRERKARMKTILIKGGRLIDPATSVDAERTCCCATARLRRLRHPER